MGLALRDHYYEGQISLVRRICVKDCSRNPFVRHEQKIAAESLGLTGEGNSGMGREGNAPIIKRERQNVI